MSSDNIRIAVVTPVYNRREITLQCLRSLSRINSDGLDVHVIVVDDASTDGTADAIRQEFPDVEIVAGTGDLWFTGGTNAGVRVALERDPKYVLMMNDDQVFDAEFLQSLVRTAERVPRSVVGSLLLLWDQPHKLFQTAPVWQTWRGGWQHWAHQTVWTIPDRPWEVDLIVGNCLLVPTEAIRECGLMDERRFPNFGDAEYTPRLKRRGWRLLIDPGSRVFCQPNNIPPRVREKDLRRLFYDLFIDLKNIHSLRRRFYACVLGGPSYAKGVAAFASFLALAIAGRSAESMAVAGEQKEPPLKEVFAGAVVRDAD
ncbi:MAG: glycosyltransferase [Pyrinomonadaceae bacterium]